jgi:DNA adenine methylase
LLMTPTVLPVKNGVASHQNRAVKPAKVGEMIPSLIKWTGSKRSQAAAIRKLMPDFERYFEPFLGGGAMLYLAARPGSVAGDVYSPLIELWKLVQTDPVAAVRDYERQWTRLQGALPEYFYEVRERFNRERSPLDLSFLMRTCVNGIVRFNDGGQFNNSFHLSRKGMEPPRFERTVFAWSERLKGVHLVCQDYEETVADARDGDFVYFDPPYAGNKQRYVEDLNTERFYTVLESLSRRGVKWAWSFDGQRGGTDLSHPVPKELYKRRLLLASGNSAVGKVLNGPVEHVDESLYLNYD